MLNEILELKKLNENFKFDFIFNFSKLKDVDIQSPSLIQFNDQKERELYFEQLIPMVSGNKYIESIDLNESGFIDITLNIFEVSKYLNKTKKEVLDTIKDPDPKEYIFDYGGPNIGKSMHVGHLRPLNIGRALYNIYSLSGNNCVSDIHLGDWGIPISQILTFCYENKIEISKISAEDLQNIYPLASKEFLQNEDFRNKVNSNLKKLNLKESKILNDWNQISNITVENVKKTLQKLNHTFDLFYGESTVVDLIPDMISKMKIEDKVELDDGALVSKEIADPPILILKSDGSYLYMTTDLATVIDREANLSPDYYIYVVDMRQSEHFKQLFSSVKFFELSDSFFEHVGFGTINDADGKPFKTREGDVYPLESLWQDIFNILREKNNEKNSSILTNSVLVYSDLLIDRRSNYKFDIKKFTNTEGKTAVYLQYTKVRIMSILNSAEQKQYINEIQEEKFSQTEKALILSLVKFSNVFNRSKKLKEPHHLADYLYEICQKFNSFYKDIKVLDSSNLNLQNRRLNLSIITLNIIELLFEILGIESVDKM